ncbi:ABC transporter permease [Corynebacterium timonense]|uniref:ABC transporter permease n=1 Tax=Corynebacterium timonense TaxID=441500 RepID=UPI0018C8C439|nr:ABC transporter permease [Corynebacterium timonense]
MLAIVWVALMVAWAIAPGLFATADPLEGDVFERLQPPSAEYWFGTDQLGRDVYSRVVHGTQLTLQSVGLALLLALVVGVAIGAVAGYAGGRTDSVFMRVIDAVLSIPSLLLSLTVIVAVGFGTANVALAIGIGCIAPIARVTRAEVKSIRNRAYIEAARAAGNSEFDIVLRHVVPNAVGPVFALAVLECGTAILMISTFSFLGYGTPPPAPEWGALVAEGRDFLAGYPWISTIPGLIIAITVIAVNRISQLLRSR